MGFRVDFRNVVSTFCLENLLGNPPKVTHEPITRIICKQLDIKLEPFTQEELDSVLRKNKTVETAFRKSTRKPTESYT